MTSAPCPCDALRRYHQCCRPLHDGAAAPTAEALMRSRYSAYVLDKHDYLMASWHASTRPATSGGDPTIKVKWLRLKVLAHRVIDADHAEVDFLFKCIEAGVHRTYSERSRFVREAGRWFYLDGDALPLS